VDAAWGLRVSPHHQVGRAIGNIFKYYERLDTLRGSLDYEIDGVVIELDDLAARERLGITAHHPRWALAYKFQPGVETTKLDASRYR
jgi:DNA ligase (NAD+)